ncbi:gamma carbonic anhydrase family protein [Helicobacter sp. 13S00401-1]|uniref:gamma carbonic anhydrase family protein n=1 Tax=Helicobacter sp. 13S00401-1 TaxID=1905758 RepID=UPI000BA5FC35|nr:gamma carbonic anhydrase family protein [Helicobacter sp. 13S00401-1]PAF50045.1 gamma carbonic anhydrase family protein [Helicobacter sp. 13S00401-1]
MLIPFIGALSTSNEKIAPTLGKDVLISEGAKVIGEVTLGDDVSVWYNCVLRADVNSIKVGARTNIQDLTCVHVCRRCASGEGGSPTTIGEEVTIGHSCIIHGCTIGNRCLIGMGAIVMDGAVIGDDSIVGAGALVTKNKHFPPRSLIMGNPAKFVRELNDEEVAALKQSALDYVNFKNDFL